MNRCLRCWRVPHLYAGLREFVETQTHLNQGVVRILGLAFLFLYFAHIQACLFFFIAWVETDLYGADYVTWASLQHLFDLDISHQYLRALYWAVVSCATIGYGDVVCGAVFIGYLNIFYV